MRLGQEPAPGDGAAWSDRSGFSPSPIGRSDPVDRVTEELRGHDVTVYPVRTALGTYDGVEAWEAGEEIRR
jgi:hypothetical protein